MTTDTDITRAIVWATAYNRVPLILGILRGWRRSRAANAVADWRSFSDFLAEVLARLGQAQR